ncbi:MAG: tetraacyldisaccharide 4'-kinase [Acidobacteriia bacterium]|nr:tetraacyldisaccharide 4'-kinase [Terriglobia bacterium]
MRRKFIYFLYRAALALAFPFILVYLLWRGLRNRAYLDSLPERLGWLPDRMHQTVSGSIWLHAVSVGEIQASAGLVRKLRVEYPQTRLFVSAGTLAGHALARERFQDLADGVFYAPLDFVFAVRSVLRCLRPGLVIVLETEIWPNLWRESKRAGASLMVLNGRISDTAMVRYRRFGWFFHAVLDCADVIHAQSRVAYERYMELGADGDRLHLAGNLKYDLEPGEPAVAVAALVERTRPSQVWIAASTMGPAFPGDTDEDEVVLDAFEQLGRDHARLLLLLAPRKPERFDVVAARLESRGIAHLRRSRLGAASTIELPGVLLVDSIGELASLFSLADVVFMGGTLAARGGHNLLEPASCGKAVISGPNLRNFPEIAEDFRAGDGLLEVRTAEELMGAVDRLLREPELRRELGARARRLSRKKAGATQRAMDAVRECMGKAMPVRPLPLLWRALLTPLSWIWIGAAASKRSRQIRGRKRLPVPVVSVGGISMGGAGKTPFAMFLGRLLCAEGRHPGFLTRGYRRRTPAPYTIVPSGGEAPVDVTGDEAQLILRAGLWPVGIGSRRYETGLKLLETCSPDVLVLDDGFQHWKLERDLDLVLIDALNPWAQGGVFPAGMMREPFSALGRASAFVITRGKPGHTYSGIQAVLRRYNATAPIFVSRLVPRGWVELATGRALPAQAMVGRAAMAFCGLGNPDSFWSSLEGLGCRPTVSVRFPDHHHYRPRELRHLASQAKGAQLEVLLTTEKDAVNLPPSAASLLEPVRIYWLRIEVEMEKPEEFVSWLRQRLPPAPPACDAPAL